MKYRVGLAAAFSFLLSIAVLAIVAAFKVQLTSNGWNVSMLLLSCLLFGSAVSALSAFSFLLFKKPWVMRSYGVFALLWAASVIYYDANIAMLSVSEMERIAGLAFAIIAPILLGFGLVHNALVLVRNTNEPA